MFSEMIGRFDVIRKFCVNVVKKLKKIEFSNLTYFNFFKDKINQHIDQDAYSIDSIL